MFAKFLKQEEAVTATEYAVMLALIILACIVAVQALGTKTSGTFETITDEMDAMPIGNG